MWKPKMEKNDGDGKENSLYFEITVNSVEYSCVYNSLIQSRPLFFLDLQVYKYFVVV